MDLKHLFICIDIMKILYSKISGSEEKKDEREENQTESSECNMNMNESDSITEFSIEKTAFPRKNSNGDEMLTDKTMSIKVKKVDIKLIKDDEHVDLHLGDEIGRASCRERV